MCYIKGTGAGRIGKFMLLKGNKVTMTLKRDRDGNICKGVFGGRKIRLVCLSLKMAIASLSMYLSFCLCSSPRHKGLRVNNDQIGRA